MSDTDAELEALLQFLYLAPVGLAQTDLDGTVLMINPLSAQLLMPLARERSLDNLYVALEGVAPDLRQRVADFSLPHGKVCDGLQLQVSAGLRGVSEAQWLSLTLLKLDASRLMAVISDVSKQVQRERLLRQNEAWMAALYTGISDYALISLDRRGHIDDWNPSIGRVTGFTRAEVMGQPYSLFYPPGATTPERVLDRLCEADENGWSLDDGWRLRADGSRFWGSGLIAPLRERDAAGAAVAAPANAGADEPAYCLVIRDISDRRDASERQRLALSCDHLTGIANRRALYEAGASELARRARTPRPLSLILFDADHFKQVNDRHGHAAGDAVLRHLAATLTAGLREVDVAARLGGEEFAVLLPSTDLDGAAAVADRLRVAISAQPLEWNGSTIAFTVSGGVAAVLDSDRGLDDLIQRADEALYRAKAAGRDRIERSLGPVEAAVRRPNPHSR